MRKIRNAAIAVIVVAASLAVATYLSRSADGKSPVAAKVLPPVKSAAGVMADGVVVPGRSAALEMVTGGAIVAVAVSDGDTVKAGQLLVRLDDTKQAAGVVQAEAGLAKAEAALDQAAGASDAVRRMAKADVSAAQACLAQAKAALSETRLRAPFSGTVAAVYAKVGELAGPGAVMVRLGDITSWLVETSNLTEASIPRVHVGDGATIGFDAFPKLNLKGRVVKIRGIGENTQGDTTYAVTIRPSTYEPSLRWNMTAQVTIGGK